MSDIENIVIIDDGRDVSTYPVEAEGFIPQTSVGIDSTTIFDGVGKIYAKEDCSFILEIVNKIVGSLGCIRVFKNGDCICIFNEDSAPSCTIMFAMASGDYVELGATSHSESCVFSAEAWRIRKVVSL